MTETVLVPLPDGSWLALDREQLDHARLRGAEFMGRHAAPGPTKNDLSPAGVDAAALVNAKEMARLTGTSSTWWEAAARRGDAPCTFVGNRRRFNPAAALKWLEVVQERD